MSSIFDALSAGAKRTAEIARLTLARNDANKKLEAALLAVGRQGYEIYRRGQLQDAVLAGSYEQVVPLEQELKRLQDELARLSGATVQAASGLCPSCQKPVNASEAFCGSCGARLPKCATCGAPLKPNDKFCGGCGAKLEGSG